MINIGSKLGHVATWINTLGVGYTTYVGRPLTPKGKYAFIQINNNSPLARNDYSRVPMKKATLEFMFVGSKEDSDASVYKMIDDMSNAIVGLSVKLPIVSPEITIGGITDGISSGVLRDINGVPYVIAEYIITYYA